MNHDLYIDPGNISGTLVHTAKMGDTLSDCYHKDDLPAYASLLEQCVRFAIPQLMDRLMENNLADAAADAGILLFRSVGPVVPAVVLEEPVVPVEVRRSMRLRK